MLGRKCKKIEIVIAASPFKKFAVRGGRTCSEVSCGVEGGMFLDVFPCFYKGKRGRGRERRDKL